jgi:A/G-specific adenine glycosylase
VAVAVRPDAGSDLILLARRPDGGLLGGLWGLPETPWEGDADPEDALPSLLATLGERLGVPLERGPSRGCVEHAFTHRSLTLEVVVATPCAAYAPGPLDSGLRWAPLADLDAPDLGLSTLARKSLALLSQREGRSSTERQLTNNLTKRRKRAGRPTDAAPDLTERQLQLPIAPEAP